MSNEKIVTIHASNVQGLGASEVAVSFIDSYIANFKNEIKIIILPSSGYESLKINHKKIVKAYRRFFPNSFSRLLECLFSNWFFDNTQNFIVLGDIPLRGINNQVVLVHQSNLVKPSIDPLSSSRLTFKVNRWLFSYNLKFAKSIIVQSEVMKRNLELSYPVLKNKIHVNPQPVPSSLKDTKTKKTHLKRRSLGKRVNLFYPSAGYPHKNHRFLLDLVDDISRFETDLQINLTLTESEFEPYKNISWITNLGRLNSEEMIDAYQNQDGLLFLSYAESFGLPLLEAMHFNLPIIAPDLPYARWMCEENAIYFNYDKDSFLTALSQFVANYDHLSDHATALEKFPSDWDEVTSYFRKNLMK